MKKKIFFTGGGSAEYVTPNIPLIRYIKRHQWEVGYVGSRKGIEKEIIENIDVTFYGIVTARFQRKLDWKSLLDPFLFLMSIMQSLILCATFRPAVVFSKGGLVAVPVVIGAWICRIPVICHESDLVPGFATRLCLPFTRYVCISYPETELLLPRKIVGDRTKLTGFPIRASLLKANAARAREAFCLKDDKPILLVLGGGTSAWVINDRVRQCRFQLLRYYQIVHIVGEGNLVIEEKKNNGYIQLECLEKGFADVLAAAHLVLSRADSNLVYELLVLRKSNLLIPLPKDESHGEQIKLAAAFEKTGMSMVVQDVDLTVENLVPSLHRLRRQRKARLVALKKFKARDAVKIIANLIGKTAK